jgi:ABC-type antimicrobial peptide transport system permease subunit
MTHIKRLAIALMAMTAEGFITIAGILMAFGYGDEYMRHGFTHEQIVIGFWIILVGTLLFGTLAIVNFSIMALRSTNNKTKETA